MKFSWHLVFQLLIVLIGSITEIFDLIPPSVKPKVLMVIIPLASLLGLINHFNNPDGTSAKLPWEEKLNKIKKSSGILSTIFFLLLIPSSLKAQEVYKNAVVLGVVGTTDSLTTNPFKFSGAFRKSIIGTPDTPGSIYLISFWDANGIQLKPFDLSKAQYSGTEAIDILVSNPISWLSLHILGEAGLVGTVDVSTGSKFGGGGYAEIRFKKVGRIWLMPKVVGQSLSGTKFEGRAYIGVAF